MKYQNNIYYDSQDGFIDAYNRGIDDFVKFANIMQDVELEDGEIRPMRLEEMAERVKLR